MCYTGKKKQRSKLNFPVYVRKEVWNCFSKVPNAIQPVGSAVSVARPGKAKKWSLEKYAQEKQWKPTSTRRFFFSFTGFVLWKCRKIKYYFFLCPVSISRIMNAKTTRISKGKTRAMETHFYTMEKQILLLDFPYEYSVWIRTIFFYPPLLFLE